LNATPGTRRITGNPGRPDVRIAENTGPLGYTLAVQNELAVISAFVQRGKRDRYREFLSSPKLRHKFTSRLAHFTDFDPQYRVPIASDKLFVNNVALELQKRHSPTVVYAISEDPSIDQREIALADALSQIVGRGMGTILSCIPGRLAFVETEDERFILERHDPLERREYIRFVVGRRDEDSHVEQGVFQAAARALEWGTITGSDAHGLNELRAWFSQNLEKPTSFGRGTASRGICWFRTDATEHISRMWEMVRILERNGIFVKKITTDRPGYLVYEDAAQIVAEPFREGTIQRK
jgi:hypothetical protein